MSVESVAGPWHGPLEFSLQFSRHDGHVVVAVHGELDVFSAPTLRERLSDLIECQGNLSIVVDLGSTTFIDVRGLAVLVDAHGWLRRRGGELLLSGPRRSATKLFEVTGLNRILAIVPAAPTLRVL